MNTPCARSIFHIASCPAENALSALSVFAASSAASA
jgi:hypothetical protein